MNWDDLRFLLAIHRERTLSAAAKSLGVNHTTVSRRLAALEAAVGVRLFDKRPDGYVATAAGEDVCEVAAEVEERVQSLDRRVLGRDVRLSGSLRVTTLGFLAIRHMDVFRGFTEEYPGIELELSVDNAPRSLTKREADAALRLTNRPPENLVGRKLLRVEFAVYGARGLVERHGDGAPLGEFPWLAWDDQSNARLTAQWMNKHVPHARISCRVDSAGVMRRAVEAEMGLAFLSCFEGDGAPQLVRMRPPEPGFGMDMWLLTHEDLRATARVRAFMDYVDAGLRPLGDRYAGALG